ncbi:MAG: sulfite exporter TauE/SafE family protein [Desulfobulbaceae bacterium]|nr:sulfite exporter TauE/SafE family protein [Desulfobulbaceae bacterium]HIJ90962.1 sulfite exporter TauE/SafE family protein [Deltaproteobacteria bacterium]
MKVKFSVLPLLALAMMVLPITQQAQAKEEASAPTITLDKPSLDNGGEITVSGQAPAGSQVYVEVYSVEKQVRANRFDSKKDPKTGKVPYMFYLTHEMPAAYKIFIPKEMAPELDKAKADGSSWKYSEVLKKTGANAAYNAPAKIKIDRYQATIMASILGSRGNLLDAMNEKDSKRESMKLVKGRFRKVDNLLAATVETTADGAYTAKMKLRKGLAPGKYNVTVTAVTERIQEGDKETVKKVKSEVASFENNVSFPTVYLSTAGTSINLLWPFLLTLVIAIFGVLMGAGGGFILNPILVSIFPALPHTIVAGTVMPTVLFAQGSGIYNYSKIKFINWKLGIGIGCAMLLGGFIGPKLTELITLDQFKFAFGWILLVLSGLMYWQTTPGYLEKNKKEQAILKEFKKRAEECAKRGEEGTKSCPTEQK